MSDRLITVLHGAYGRTFDASAYNPILSGFTFYLKPRPWHQFGFTFDYLLTNHLHINLGLSYTGLSYGRSQTAKRQFNNFIVGLEEPNSITHYLNTYLGLTYDFADTNNKQNDKVTNSLQQLNNQAGFSVLGLYQYFNVDNYSNYRSPIFSISKAFIPGWQLHASKAYHHIIFDLMSEYARGEAHFKIKPSSYSTSHARTSHFQSQANIGYQWQWRDNTALEPLVAIGYQQDLYSLKYNPSLQTQSNIYHFWYIGPGIKAIWLLDHRRLGLMPSVTAGYTLSNTAIIPNISGNLHPKSAPWVDLDCDFDYALSAHLHLTTGMNYRFVKFKQSNPQTVSTTPSVIAIQPNAKSQIVSLKLGLAYDFA